MFLQKTVGLTEWLAAEKSVIRRKRTGMRRFQNQVVGVSQHPLLGLSRPAPQDKNNGPVLLIQSSRISMTEDINSVSERSPSEDQLLIV